jgi:hypothetical protein
MPTPTIDLIQPDSVRPYACGGITINPDPPALGQLSTITFALRNTGTEPLGIERIETRIARFGMGVTWETLPPIGPFQVPPDPNHIELATLEWTPDEAGHRCVRASIFPRDGALPLTVGRNLHVIQAREGEMTWRVPFRLGNPEPVRAPILLRHDGDPALIAMVRVQRRIIPIGRPVWLEAHEEVTAELLLRSHDLRELRAVRSVEAWMNGRLVDGIAVTVRRPALARLGAAATNGPTPQTAFAAGGAAAVEECELARV